MLEYCCFTYAWVGQGWTQEIDQLRQKGKVLAEWKGRYWSDFLNQMAKQGWEVVTIMPLGDSDCVKQGAIAYFKRVKPTD